MYCPYCGNQILAEDAIYCNKCGSKVGDLTAPANPRTTIPFGQPGAQQPPNTIPSPRQPRPTVQFPPYEQPRPSNTTQFPPDLSQPGTSVPFPPPQQHGPRNTIQFPPYEQHPVPRSQFEQRAQPMTPPAQPIFPQQATQPFLPLTEQTPPYQQRPDISHQPTFVYRQSLAAPPVSPPIASAPTTSQNRLQRFMVGTFQTTLAGNAFFGIILGSLIASILGTGICSLLLNIVYSFFPATAKDSSGILNIDRIQYALGIIPVHAPLRDSLQLFLVIQGIVFHFQSIFGNTSSFTYAYFQPLHGLLFLPALLLTLGGYIAASTDLQNRVLPSLQRGALVAVPYTLILLLMAFQVNGNILDTHGVLTPDNGTVAIDIPTLLLFGLLWGVLFGVLGASLKVAGGQWRSMLHYFLRTSRHPQVLGSITGGVIAALLGCTFALLVVFSAMANATYSTPIVMHVLCSSAEWQLMSVWNIVQGPVHAVNLFAFSFGAPVTLVNQPAQACFYTNNAYTVFSLFDSNLHLSSWYYALLLLPGISLFLGGRASVAIAHSQGLGPAAIQGAAICLPFTILMVGLTALGTINNTSSGSSSTPQIQSVGVAITDVLLWALLSGALLGMLGGMYQVSGLRPTVSCLLALLASPLLTLCKPLYALLDLLSGQPANTPSSTARNLVYGACMCAVLVAIAAFITGVVLINTSYSISYLAIEHTRDIISVLIIALPGFVLLCAAISALSTNPQMVHQQRRAYAEPPTIHYQGGYQ